MKFRFVLLQPDDNPDRYSPARKEAAALPHNPPRALRYEQRGTDMVRVEQSKNGHWKFTSTANFTARIVRDIILDDGDDGEEERREFGVEAEVAGQKLAFSISAAEF